MSIYVTLWTLKFPIDEAGGDKWVEVIAQGVPAHVGTPTHGYGYESGDPYAAFLPTALKLDSEASENLLRAVVFIVRGSGKGTARAGQEYLDPLLTLTGSAYAGFTFQDLYDRLQSILRERQGLVATADLMFRMLDEQEDQS